MRTTIASNNQIVDSKHHRTERRVEHVIPEPEEVVEQAQSEMENPHPHSGTGDISQCPFAHILG
jgi:hypothetical protein